MVGTPAQCLPRTRGFTGLLRKRRTIGYVSSPYAGVHLSMRPIPRPPRRVFPVRGGSPEFYRDQDLQTACLPRTRGFVV